MNYFELSWCWYEDYCPHIFSHETKTKVEFDADVKNLMKKYGNEYMGQENSWVGAHGWIEFTSKKLPELGYIPIIPETYSVFGANIIRDCDEDSIKFGNIIGEDLLNKASEHNRQLEIELEIDLPN
jgi:hypothetical protein